MAGCPNNTCHGEQGSGAISITEAEEVTGWEQVRCIEVMLVDAVVKVAGVVLMEG